jgi:hypothetical protein
VTTSDEATLYLDGVRLEDVLEESLSTKRSTYVGYIEAGMEEVSLIVSSMVGKQPVLHISVQNDDKT